MKKTFENAFDIDNKGNTYFDKNNTYIIKGIAVIFMVLHHFVGLFYNNIDIFWYGQFKGSVPLILLFFSTAGKVCVPLFTIISGFGITKSYIYYNSKPVSGFKNSGRKNVLFVVSHLVQFYSFYWVIFIILAPFTYIKILGDCYVNNCLYKGIFNLVLDFLGIKPTLSWYVSTIIILYILFPLLYFFVKRFKLIPLFFSLIPWILKPLINNAGISDDNVFLYLLSFISGIFFAENDVLDKLKQFSDIEFKIFSAFSVVVCFAFRLVFSLYADYFFALSILCFGTLVLSEVKFLNKSLILFGKHSSNIWLIHGTIILYLPNLPLPDIVKFLIILLLALSASLLIEIAKKKTGYLFKVKQLRSFIEKQAYS